MAASVLSMVSQVVDVQLTWVSGVAIADQVFEEAFHCTTFTELPEKLPEASCHQGSVNT